MLNDVFYRTILLSRYQKSKASLDINETRDDGILGCCGISWTMCKQSAPRSRQVATSTPHHSIFYRSDALLDAQPTVSKQRGVEEKRVRHLSAAELEDHVDRRIVLEETVEVDDVRMTKTAV